MERRVLLVASVLSHICQFHKPLMRLLKSNGYEIHVAARDNLAEKNGLQLEYPDKVFDIPFSRSPMNIASMLRSYSALKEILKENRYEVVHCNTPVAGVVTRLVARNYRKTGTKVFYTAHGFHFYKGAPKKNWIIYYPIELLMSFYTDTLITINEEDYLFAKKNFHCKVVRTHGVGASTERYSPVGEMEKQLIRKELNINGFPILLNVGELRPNKNQKTAISAMPHILKQYPKAQLFIAGNGPLEETLKKQIADMNLEKHVKLLGYTTKSNEYVKACDVLVACSYREGMPLNIMEAMLCGKPVVASHNRGHDELVEDGKTGYLINPDDSFEYAVCIARVMNKPDNFSERALKAVIPYSEKSVSEELKGVYGL